MKGRWLLTGALHLAFVAAVSLPALSASAQGTPSQLEAIAKRALDKLVAKVPAAKTLNEDAVAVLVFPRITRVGFVFGGQYGEGVLRKGGKVAGYYNSVAASYGLQAGVQSFGYALFFMTDGALAYLDKSEGFEIGVGPSIVVVDEGTAKTLTTTTGRKDVYAFIFSQKGLMAGLGLQGSKISRIEK